MSTFTTCKNCNCNEDEVKIYKCEECGKIFCEVCADPGFFVNRCPDCNERGLKLGVIKSKI
jgi:DNA-directed RNA polymerase subunit RPC12/RpoP